MKTILVLSLLFISCSSTQQIPGGTTSPDLTSVVSALKIQVNNLTTSLNALQQKDADKTASILTLKDQISALTVSVAALKSQGTQVSDLQKSVSSLTAQSSSLSNAVSSLADTTLKSIDFVYRKIDTLNKISLVVNPLPKRIDSLELKAKRIVPLEAKVDIMYKSSVILSPRWYGTDKQGMIVPKDTLTRRN